MIKKRGRKKISGRFNSRKELCKFVWWDYLNTKRNCAEIAKDAKVSVGTVHLILNKREGYKNV